MPLLALADCAPQIGKGMLGHMWVADDIVGLAQQLILAVARDGAECSVTVGYNPFGIGFGDDDMLFIEHAFVLGDRRGVAGHC